MTNDTTETTPTDDQFPTDCNSTVFGQVGTGKTDHIATELARHHTDDTDSVEFTDPKGEGKRMVDSTSVRPVAWRWRGVRKAAGGDN
jgi:hypothetical protein